MKKSILICLAAMSLLLSTSCTASNDTAQSSDLKTDTSSISINSTNKNIWTYESSNGYVDKYGIQYEEGGIVITGYNGSDNVITVPETIDGKTVVGCIGDIFGRLDENGEFISSVTEICFPKDMHSVILPYYENIETITFPDGQTSVRKGCFKQCTNLKSFDCPSELTSIGDSAFSGCGSLTDVTFNDKLESIGSAAFYNTSLTKIALPESLKEIGASAFSDCANLQEVELPEGVNKIGKGAFRNTAITSINLPSELTEIENGMFLNCTSLASVEIPNKVQKIGANAFENCTLLKTISIPDSVESIDESAFKGCDDLIINCSEGSYAERYASEHGFSYIVT